MAIEITLGIDNDNYVELDKLQNQSSAASVYVNDATVTADVFTSAGVQVTGASLPIMLPYVAASDGKYRGVFQDTLALVEGDYYRIRIDAAGDSLTLVREFWVKAVKVRN